MALAAENLRLAGAPPAVIILFVLAVAAVVIISLYMSHKRRQALRDFAASRGLRYYAHDPYGLSTRFRHTDLCSKGRSRKARNVITGPVGDGEVFYFDYQYTTGSGKNRQTHHYGACAFVAPYYMTRMTVRPENVLDKVAGFFGFDDVDLDHAEFNRKFYVSCPDKKFAYDVLSQRVMQFFLDGSGAAMEMSDDYLVFHRSGKPGIDKVAALIDAASGFFDLLPNYLKKDRQMQPLSDAASDSRGPTHASNDSFDGITPKKRTR